MQDSLPLSALASPDAFRWYYAQNETVIGPMPFAALQALWKAGELPADTFVVEEESEAWRPLSDVMLATAAKPASMPPPLPTQSAAPLNPSTETAAPLFRMKGHGSRIEVFADKVELTPSGITGFMNHGLKGTKSIPLHSITAIQFKEAGLVTLGYLQFTISGGNESRGGMFAAAQDENSFTFNRTEGNNEQAKQIKAFLETKMRELHAPQHQAPTISSASIADELRKLAELKAQGVLTEPEFQAAKQRLLA